MALTKKQREFFDRFSRNILVNTLIMRLDQAGMALTDEDVAKINLVVDSADVSSISKAASEKLLEKVDFATLVKVEKFLTAPETKKALDAAQEVGIAVQVEVYDTLNQLFSESPVVE